jgi:hypothetical protein
MTGQDSSSFRNAVYALYGLLSSIDALNEELALFARARQDQTPAEVAVFQAKAKVHQWCLDAEESDVGDAERVCDEIVGNVLEQSQSLSHLGPKEKEAFILAAVVMVLDEFCGIAERVGHTCSNTPIPALRSALIESLGQDYGIDLTAASPDRSPALDQARALATRWRSWADGSITSPS